MKALEKGSDVDDTCPGLLPPEILSLMQLCLAGSAQGWIDDGAEVVLVVVVVKTLLSLSLPHPETLAAKEVRSRRGQAKILSPSPPLGSSGGQVEPHTSSSIVQ